METINRELVATERLNDGQLPNTAHCLSRVADQVDLAGTSKRYRLEDPTRLLLQEEQLAREAMSHVLIRCR